MSEDGKLLQHIFDLFNPLVRDGWTVDRIVDSVNRTTFFFGNGASRVRIDANRVPFTVGCQKPVVMFRLNQYALNGKELSFNVI